MKDLPHFVKPKSPGVINPCARAAITDEKGIILAWCLDTPNAIAFAFSELPSATHAIAFYPNFKPNETARQDLLDRVQAKGYGMTKEKACFEIAL